MLSSGWSGSKWPWQLKWQTRWGLWLGCDIGGANEPQNLPKHRVGDFLGTIFFSYKSTHFLRKRFWIFNISTAFFHFLQERPCGARCDEQMSWGNDELSDEQRDNWQQGLRTTCVYYVQRNFTKKMTLPPTNISRTCQNGWFFQTNSFTA